jgi:hypothetical protein
MESILRLRNWSPCSVAIDGQALSAFQTACRRFDEEHDFLATQAKVIVEGAVFRAEERNKDIPERLTNDLTVYHYVESEAKIWYIPECSREVWSSLPVAFGFAEDREVRTQAFLAEKVRAFLGWLRTLDDLAILNITPSSVFLQRRTSSQPRRSYLEEVFKFNRELDLSPPSTEEIQEYREIYKEHGLFTIGVQ